MTCKVSFIKAILETMKHHLASIFTTIIIFFVQLLVFFLYVQNISTDSLQEITSSYIGPDLSKLSHWQNEILSLTRPSGIYVIPVMFIAILLAFDFFRYLHSKKQVDFYDSLPMRRKDWFVLRATSSFLVFLIPYVLCTLLEMLLLATFGFRSPIFFINLLWNFLCMILIFIITWLTASLAMIMTGHLVVACFGLGVFCGYAPVILRYLYPAYASEFFKTYVTDGNLFNFLEYVSPIGVAIKLLNSNYLGWTAKNHSTDFIILIILIILMSILTYVLFIKRPSESAGRAMAFEKCNPCIRILLVIPMTLYLGLYLSQVTSVAPKLWMLGGFLIGTILLHGIIESIFQFDVRKFGTHKKQMAFCMLIILGFTSIFWFDFFHYNQYLPEKDEVKSIQIELYGDDSYNENADGIHGESIKDALLLAESIIEQNNVVENGTEDYTEGIEFQYHLKNGTIKYRQYSMNPDLYADLLDKIYATEDYKDDICALYQKNEWNQISYIEWNDNISEFALYLTEAELEQLFETYMSEYTPLTYTQVREETPLGQFRIYYGDLDYYNYSCYVYPKFTQTISLLEDALKNSESGKDYGSIMDSPIKKYPATQIEIYYPKSPKTISNLAVLDSLKEHLLLTDSAHYKLMADFNWDSYYDATLSLQTKDGINYISVLIPKTIADSLN